MTMRTFAAIALLALSTLATAAGVENDQELYQRQYQYAHIMMRLNGIDGDATPAELSKMKVSRTDVNSQRNLVSSQRETTLDAFADAAEHALKSIRAKKSLSKEWRINEPYPSYWSVTLNPEAAADCSHAIEHPLGHPLRIQMNRDGTAWLRVVAPSKGHWAYDTLISDFDTKLSVYRDCRDIGREPKSVSDDTVGLGSIVGIDATASGQTWLVKLERKGGMGSFAIAKGNLTGTISGRVTRARDGSAIWGAYVGSIGGGASSTYTNHLGEYELQVYSDGEHYIRAGYFDFDFDYNATIDYVNELYPGAVCASASSQSIAFCNGAMTPVVFSTTEQLTGIDFSLDTATIVAGFVTDEATGYPLPNATVHVFAAEDVSEEFTVRTLETDSTGRYRVGALPSQPWRVQFSHPGHASERWNGVPCAVNPQSECTPGSGNELLTTVGAIAQASAALARFPHIDVRVMSRGAPVPTAHLTVYTAGGAYVTNASAAPDPMTGVVSVGPLEPGSYRLVAHSLQNFSKVFGGTDCVALCVEELLSGQTIEVSTSMAPITIDLRRQPSIRGRLTRQSDESGISGATVTLYTSSGHYQSVGTDDLGAFDFGPLNSRDYYLGFSAYGFVDELHENVVCENGNPITNCPPSAQIHIGLASPDVQVINAALQEAASLRGTIRGIEENSGINRIALERVDATGAVQQQDYVELQNDRSYEFLDVPPGTHYWGVHEYGYYKQLYVGLNCGTYFSTGYTTCSLANATPINLVSGQIRDNVDFRLIDEGQRPLRVLSEESGEPIPGIVIDQWNMSGQWLRSVITDSQGWADVRPDYAAGAQSYFAVQLSTDGLGRYIDEVYDNLQCPNGTSVYRGGCSLVGAWIVPITDANETLLPALFIHLRSADPLFKSDFE